MSPALSSSLSPTAFKTVSRTTTDFLAILQALAHNNVASVKQQSVADSVQEQQQQQQSPQSGNCPEIDASFHRIDATRHLLDRTLTASPSDWSIASAVFQNFTDTRITGLAITIASLQMNGQRATMLATQRNREQAETFKTEE
ncbi:hypothetical protein Vi05172_g154 [Venturia inaequalis]|nr:hypothetical protein Vi05172_g154 [Venturia inaequalis]